jgi:hypothetical protein
MWKEPFTLIETRNLLDSDKFLFILMPFLFVMVWEWVHSVLRPLFGLLYQPRMIDDDECGAVGGMRIGRGNRSTRRKSATVPLCPPQIRNDLTRTRTREVAVGIQRLTTWAMAPPFYFLDIPYNFVSVFLKCKHSLSLSLTIWINISGGYEQTSYVAYDITIFQQLMMPYKSKYAVNKI